MLKVKDKVYINHGATFVYRDKDASYGDGMDIVGLYSEFEWEVVGSDARTSLLKRTDGETITIEIANKDIRFHYN